MSKLVEHFHLDGEYAVKDRLIIHPIPTAVSDYIRELEETIKKMEDERNKRVS